MVLHGEDAWDVVKSGGISHEKMKFIILRLGRLRTPSVSPCHGMSFTSRVGEAVLRKA
jgi:hypothetical protein